MPRDARKWKSGSTAKLILIFQPQYLHCDKTKNGKKNSFHARLFPSRDDDPARTFDCSLADMN